jgi:hypothetical protein
MQHRSPQDRHSLLVSLPAFVFTNPGPHAGWRTRAALARDQSYLGALRFVVGYGYQTWRALIGLLVILVADAGAGLGLGAGHTRSSPTQYVATHPGHRQPGYGVLGGLRRAERLGAPPPSVPPSRPTLETGPRGIGATRGIRSIRIRYLVWSRCPRIRTADCLLSEPERNRTSEE